MVIVNDHNALKEFAELISLELKPGQAIGLIGQLGAGKTTFVQYLAKSLGINETIKSPTYVFVKTYDLKDKLSKFVHIDAYRLKNIDDAQTISLPEIIQDKNSIVCIEWADKVMSLLPKETRLFRFKSSLGKRTITENQI